MSRKIKLIWDFRGPNSEKIAIHHEIHLKEYVISEKLNLTVTGIEQISEMYSIAFLIVEEDKMKFVRNALKPHRGQIYEDLDRQD